MSQYVLKLAKELRAGVQPFDVKAIDKIVEAVSNATVVMIGEETHGTEEFYRIRAEITKRLISDKNFTFVAWEADWPDTYRVHRYTYAPSDRKVEDKSAVDALGDFTRFPKWMWRNNAIVDFVEWLREFNKTRHSLDKVGVYGLDLYSMYASAEKVIEYLEKVSPEDAETARKRYATLQLFRENPHEYAEALKYGSIESCEEDVVKMLTDIIEKGPEYLLGPGGYVDGDELFYATANANVVKNAEEYYRNTYQGGTVTWNLRDSHMCETLQNLCMHHSVRGVSRVKAVIWAHNSHLGDCRATGWSERGEMNLGQLVRENFGLENTFNIGFSTFSGSVTAADSWGGPATRFELLEAEPESYEYLFHYTSIAFPESPLSSFYTIFRSNSPTPLPESVETARRILATPRSQRAVGVQYRKETEIVSHYIHTCITWQFDVLIHLDQTSALVPIDNDN